MTKVAVVVLSYNGIELLTKFLPGILAEKIRFSDMEVVVVDNASYAMKLNIYKKPSSK